MMRMINGFGLTSRGLRRRLPLVIIAVAAMVFGMWGNAWAGHGSWTSHHLYLYYPGTSSQHSYADVGATYNTDYSHAYWEGPPGSESVTCTGNCSYRKTATRYFGGGYPQLSSTACSRDGSHTLWGISRLYPSCSASYTCEGCPTHEHNSATHVWPP